MMGDQWQETSVANAQVRDDDDEDVPDAWEDEPEEKPKKPEVEEKPEVPTKAPPTTKNKINKKKYADDGYIGGEKFLESLKEPEREYTAEELEELKKRAELEKEELKLKMASDFVGTSSEHYSLDNVNLVTKDEFLDYSFRLYNRLENLSKSEFYPEFLDDLLTGLTKPMSLEGIKRLSIILQTVLLRKQNDERQRKLAAKTKKSFKPQLKTERPSEYDSFIGEGITTLDIDVQHDEDIDFM